MSKAAEYFSFSCVDMLRVKLFPTASLYGQDLASIVAPLGSLWQEKKAGIRPSGRLFRAEAVSFLPRASRNEIESAEYVGKVSFVVHWAARVYYCALVVAFKLYPSLRCHLLKRKFLKNYRNFRCLCF